MNKKLLTIILILVNIFIGININSQNLSLYRNSHQKLLAHQTTINSRIYVDECRQYASYLYTGKNLIFEKIDDTHWNSDKIAPWEQSEIPNNKEIILDKFNMPCKGGIYITSKYGYRARFGRFHYGIDLRAAMGDTIYASFDGIVRLQKFERAGYGFYVVIRHENGLETLYAHLSRFLVSPNTYVKAGTPIALSGNTGRSTGPHLHYEIRFMGQAINPEDIVKFEEKRLVNNTYAFRKSSTNNQRQIASTNTYRKSKVKSKRRR